MSRFTRTLFCLFLLSLPSPIFAGESQPGLVGTIVENNSSRAFFTSSGARISRPSCATYDRWVMDTSQSAGQAMLTMLLTAYSLGKQVYVYGTGACGQWGDSESIDYIRIVD